LVIKLIIFDFDGTLVDTALDIMDAANKMLSDLEYPPLTFEEVKKHIGEGFTPFIRSLTKASEKEVFERFQKNYDQNLFAKTKFYDGVEDFFKDYQRYPETKIGIISNKPENQVRLIFKELGKGLGLEESHLVQIFGAETFDVKKPHPKPLQEMMALANAKPEETVMIGDSRADVEAAKAAGTHFIAVSFGYNTFETLKSFGADNFIHHFDELIPLLESLGTQAG